jgi:hypothetical protein
LRIVNGEHAKSQLRLIWLPTGRAYKNVNVFCLDDKLTQGLQLKPKSASVALCDAVLAG